MSRKKHRDKTIIKTAGTLVSFLRHNGVRIMRYDSYSSNSIYLKLDYGLLYSIRISDHRGKEHLRYRFNVIKGYKGPRYVPTKWGWQREFYQLEPDDLNDLCMQILYMKEAKLREFGPFRYQTLMEKRQRMHATEHGFWQMAKDLG
ncbi:hypothetical protein [Levilactobacillus sp. HBUAS70063]|uniref:hypothetical protein n=1 Tax=Levilactobacillus sp. HBUAS70063 TaxID=3109359 RepID=UPI0031330194